MAVVVSDDFERADSADLGAAWAPFSDDNNGGQHFAIVSGVAKPTNLSSVDGGEVNSTTLAADHWAEAVLNSSGSGGSGSGCGVTWRASAAGSGFGYYRAVGNGAGWEATEWGGGSFVGSIGGSGTTFTAGDTIYGESQGSTWKVKKGTANGAGGTQLGTGTDSTLNANIRAGIAYSTNDGSNSGIRSFVMGDFSGGGGQTVTVGLVTETDSVFALTFAKAMAVGLTTETDSVLTAKAVKTIVAGLNTEADSALALGTVLKTVTVGLNTETDAVFALGSGRTISVGQPEETDSALATSKLKTLIVGLPVEIDSSLAAQGALVVVAAVQILRRAITSVRVFLRRG